MTAPVAITVLGRLGSAVRFSKITVGELTAHESALRLRTRSPAPPTIGATTTRSFAVTSVAEEVLRLLPARPDFCGPDSSPIQIPWEALGAFATAPDGVAASYVRAMMRWADLPECLSSVQRSVTAEFFVTTDGPAGGVARWWVSGDSGWVGLGLEGGQLAMVPSSLEDIRQALLIDLVGAITARRP